jgi:hypothetical protein
MRQVNNNFNGGDDIDIHSTIFKLRELEHIYTQAKNDAMKLRRKLEGKKIVIAGNRAYCAQLNHCDCEPGNENRDAALQVPPSQPQKRGRGRPRKIKESVEVVRGDVVDDHVDDGTPRIISCDCDCNCNSEKISNPGDEFINAIYSIENDQLYVKTKDGKFYDIDTMQLRGWFNPYLKTSVWVE